MTVKEEAMERLEETTLILVESADQAQVEVSASFSLKTLLQSNPFFLFVAAEKETITELPSLEKVADLSTGGDTGSFVE